MSFDYNSPVSVDTPLPHFLTGEEAALIFQNYSRNPENKTGDWRKDRQNSREFDSRVRESFARGLRDEHLPGVSDAVAERVFDHAWVEGHSAGYQDVENHYITVADLILFALSN